MATEIRSHRYEPGCCDERRAAAVHRPVSTGRRRAVVRLTEQHIAHLLQLPEGMRVLGVRDDFLSLSVLVMVEGEQLAPVADNAALPMLEWACELIEPTDFMDDTPARIRLTPPKYQAAP